MSVSYATLVEHMYQGFLGRDPEPGAVPAWVGRLEAGMDVADLVRTFLASEEFRVRDAPAAGFFAAASRMVVSTLLGTCSKFSGSIE